MTVRLTRRRFAGGLALAALAAPALAQDSWPRRTITIIVPAAAGGATDIVTRIIAARMQAALGVSVVVDNRGGAGGSVATEAGAAAAPDGHVLTMGQLGTLAVNPHLYPTLRYDPLRDFAPVALIAQVPMVLVANPSLGVKDLAGFVALARSKPGFIEYGSAGSGSNVHIGMVAFAERAGLDLVHVPYRGSAAMLPSLLSGDIKAALSGTPAMLPQVRAGKLVALGVSAPERIAQLPDVPALAEAYPGFEAMQWYGLIAPVRTPPAVVERLAAVVNAAIATPEVAEKLALEGAKPDIRTPAAFRALIESEQARWGALVKRAGLKPDN